METPARRSASRSGHGSSPRLCRPSRTRSASARGIYASRPAGRAAAPARRWPRASGRSRRATTLPAQCVPRVLLRRVRAAPVVRARAVVQPHGRRAAGHRVAAHGGAGSARPQRRRPSPRVHGHGGARSSRPARRSDRCRPSPRAPDPGRAGAEARRRRRPPRGRRCREPGGARALGRRLRRGGDRAGGLHGGGAPVAEPRHARHNRAPGASGRGERRRRDQAVARAVARGLSRTRSERVPRGPGAALASREAVAGVLRSRADPGCADLARPAVRGRHRRARPRDDRAADRGAGADADRLRPGLPAIAAPNGLHDGVPVGVQIIGGPCREDLCFEAAAVVEAHCFVPTPIDPVRRTG